MELLKNALEIKIKNHYISQDQNHFIVLIIQIQIFTNNN